MKLSELEMKREAAKQKMADLIAARDQAGTEFTPEQLSAFNTLEGEIKKFNTDIETERRVEEMRKQTVINKANPKTPEQKVVEKASLVKIIKGLSDPTGRKIDGVEAELHQEAENELRGTGVTLQGIGLPSWFVRFKGTNVDGVDNTQRRDLSSAGSGTGDDWVQSIEIGHQFGLEIAPKAFGLGVDVLTGLTSNVYLTETGEAAAVWETENSSADETTPATDRPVSLSPKRLAAFTDLSKTLLTQVPAAEQRVRTQLQKAVNRKLDYTIFQGTGIAPIPTGITATNGVITSVSAQNPTKQTFLDSWAAVVGNNAPSNLAAVMTPAIYSYLQGAYLDAGSGRFVIENGQITGVGMMAEWSNNIPTNYIIVGDFAQFVVGQWGGIELVVNPYTKAKENLLEIVINANFDMGCYRPKSFVVISDATLS